METQFGCSGYHYNDWRNKFYPEKLPKRKWLSYYAEHFNTVELNSTFYKIPKESTFETWYNETPEEFRFTVKGSKYITHTKKLKEVGEFVNNFYHSISPLKEKCICVLWQLPGNIKKNEEKLEAFCKTLSDAYINVIEFRDNSWFSEPVYEIMNKYQVTLAVVSAPEKVSPIFKMTSPHTYFRFHGKTEWYNYYYSEEELQRWAEELKKLNPRIAFAYFNNDYNANAVENCKIFQNLLL